MVIYNHKKEFVGIEEKDLRALKLSSLAELQSEAADFADLFVKTPGHIHNFKHVHWLDFIGSADSIDENRVIISVKGRNFKAVVEVQKLYLVDAPEKEAYGVVLSGLRELTREENERISGDLSQRVAPVGAPTTPPPSSMDDKEEMESQDEPTPVAPSVIDDPYAKEEVVASPQMEEEEELSIDLGDSLYEETPQETLPEPEIEQRDEDLVEISTEELSSNQPKEGFEIEDDDKFRDYRYDPELAAKELGLPADLVEEFIQDFIAQAHEFKPDLYEALDAGRMDNLRMLSHKLKGVAANLRIEDAYDALVTINTSDDIDLVKHTLDKFYNYIIKKLAGEDVEALQAAASTPPPASAEPEQIEEIKLELDAIELDEPEQEESSKQATQPEEEKLELALDDDIFEQEDQSEFQEEQTPSLEQESQEDEDEKLELLFDEEEEENAGEEAQVSESTQEEAPQEEEELFELSLDEPEDTQSEEEESLLLQEESVSIDKEHAASELGIDTAAYEELLGDYVTDAKMAIEQMEQALTEGDDENLKRLAIRLKGMSENMHLTEITKNLERLVTEQDADKASLIASIKQQIDSINGMV